MNPIQVETFVCSECGGEFEATCLAEFEEKEKKHKCQVINQKVVRTEAAQQLQTVGFVNDLVTDRLAQHNFDKLIKRGVICRGVGYL